MKLNTLIAGGLISLAGSFALASCAGDGLQTDALNATRATLQFYGEVVQPGIITFGMIPTCPQPAGALCKDPATWARIQATDAQVTASIVAARAALNGTVQNSGQAASAIAAINGSLVVYSGAGVKLGN